ncbi:MAG TPA: hypothetical protein VNJ05_09065 [Sphingomicrobium sp.]|nr:hypothetical protein [Sphingomicrobium sp.]
MHSFQPSRGRILFEVLCAFGIVASCVGAWKQTGASALLLAAAVAGLYGFVHLFDLARRQPVVAEEPQRIDFEPAAADIVVPMVAVEELPAVAVAVDEAEAEVAAAVEPAAPRSGSGRRKGGSRKGTGRRAKASNAAQVSVPEPAEEVVAPWPTVEVAPEPAPGPAEEFAFAPEDDTASPHIAPLFEPEPFVRMPRQAFGRRGRI